MDKLQFDSFYKFTVSLGIVLIVAPVLFIYFFISNSYGLVFSQQEYEQLSKITITFIDKKVSWINNCIKWFPHIMIGLMILGIACFIWGSIHWYKIQKERDKKINLENKELEGKIHQLNPSEIAEKTINEIEFDSKSAMTSKSKILKVFQVENACYLYIQNKLRSDTYSSYNLKQNMRIGKYEYDIIATSRKKSVVDRIYEIKYFTNTSSSHIIKETYTRLVNAGKNYELITGRSFRLILLIVSNDNIISNKKAEWERYILDEKILIDLVVIDESSL